MSKRFFDYDDGDFGMTISDNMAIDSDGNLTDILPDVLRENIQNYLFL